MRHCVHSPYLLGVLSVLVACTNAHNIGDDAPQPSAAGERALVTQAETPAKSSTLCMRLSALQCAAEQHCCTRSSRTLSACQTARQSDCEQTAHLDAIAANPVVGYDAAAADSFLSELQGKLEACDPEVVRWSAGQAGLRNLFKGSVAQGQSCKPAQLLSTDEAQQAAALLACRDGNEVACLPASLLGEWTCTLKGDSGASCLTDDNCGAADAYCATNAQAIFGTCQARQAVGAACSSNTQCASYACVSGSCQPPDVQHAFCPSDAG